MPISELCCCNEKCKSPGMRLTCMVPETLQPSLASSWFLATSYSSSGLDTYIVARSTICCSSIWRNVPLSSLILLLAFLKASFFDPRASKLSTIKIAQGVFVNVTSYTIFIYTSAMQLTLANSSASSMKSSLVISGVRKVWTSVTISQPMKERMRRDTMLVCEVLSTPDLLDSFTFGGSFLYISNDFTYSAHVFFLIIIS
eukprot:TRINITY_DN12971_c0_g6_i4.p2 TRINITY_DN12971_c0_g6~~TRINITY_DN12971_c0_g6_i4.p2  ORF type:complete len:200 (-),score=7.76 TRINITY_DN12971_c0_g6_i4:38-637(-)